MGNKKADKYPFGLSRKLYRLNVGMAMALFVIVAATAAVIWIRAADVSNMKDTLSNQSVNGTATHRISFDLSGGNTFASGEVIAIDFASAFSVGGTWQPADFTFDDGTARTIDAVAQGPGTSTVSCTDGANNVGVAVDTTDLVFRVIPCGGSFTPSAAGASVLLTIYGAVPDGWIANPATAGAYSVLISDAGGECDEGDCVIWVAIVDTSDVSVTATVVSPAVCGNGTIEPGEGCDDGNTVSGDGCSATCQVEGGGPPPPSDTTPPVISGISVVDITTTTARVTWTTNEASTSLVRYGLTSSYGSQASVGGYVNSHSVPLSGLTEATTYHFQVCSTDSPGNQACSSDQTFSTLDETPPVISNVQVTNITATGATITWTTNENADSKVDYGLTAGPPYTDTETDGAMVTSHSIDLTGLSSGTTYHFRVRSGDGSGNEAFTSDAVFTTADGDAPVISNIRVTDITATTAIVRWDTDESSDSKVDYGLTSSYTDTETDAAMVIAHAVTLTGLSSSTTYHYRVRSADASSNEASSGDLTFSTADATPPVISNIVVSNITATGARITWTTDENSTSAVDYGTTTSYGGTTSDAGLVTSHTIDLTGLSPDTLYHFRVRSSDAGSNEAISVDGTFTTLKPAPPVLSNIRVTNITESSGRVQWDSTTSSNSVVNYGLTTSYGSTQTNPAMGTAHLVVLNGLSTGTLYHYRVRSTDAYGQETVSSDRTFTTVADTTPPANPTGFTATPGDSQVQLNWINPTDTDFQGVIVKRKTGSYPTGPTDGTTVYTGTGTAHLDLGRTNGITYYYAIYAYDEVPNYSSGALANATPTGAPDTTPPGNVTGFTAAPGNMEIQLNWTNPTDADFAGVRIKRGPAGGTCPTGPADGTTVYEGLGESWNDVGLTNGTLYCYAAFAFDGVPNYASGVTASATPTAPPDTVPPGNVISLTATAGDRQVGLTWTNPVDPDFQGTTIVRKTGSSPTGPSDGIIVYDGSGNSAVDSGLTNDTTYYYGAFAHDAVPNYASGAFAQATPSGTAPPLPPPPCTDNDGGQNYLVRGTVTTPTDSFIDACVERTVLQEYYCDALNYTSELHDCGLGYKCSAGKCTPDTFVPLTTVCGNGICESRDCDVNCSLMTYDLYIINPDGSEIHMGTSNVRETVIESGISEFAYEDNSGAFDYDDVVMRLDTRDCRSVTVTLVSHNGSRNHIVRMRVSYEGAAKFDDYLWQDVLVPVGSTWNKNCAADPTICVGNENPLNCPDDCVEIPEIPEVEEEEPTVSQDERLTIEDLRFYATRARMPLVVRDATVEVFPATSVVVYLPDESIRKPIQRVFVNFTGSSYSMKPVNSYEATVGTPTAIGDYPLTVLIEYEDGTNDSIDATIGIRPFGRVTDDKGNALPGARVTLYVDLGGGNFGLWDGTPYGMSNPQIAREDGKYGFIVPPGTYQLRASLDGYRDKETLAFPISNNLVGRNLTLIKKPQVKVEDIAKIITETEDIGKAVQDVAQAVGEEAAYQAKVAAENVTEFVQNEQVETQTEQVAAPTVAAVAVANVAVAGATTATAIPYLIYLYSLLTHPSILFLGRRRKKWGVVYDAITKKPVDLAIVRLVDDRTGKILRSMVTDKDGRYFFIVEPGAYRMTVAKSGFVFPTVYLEGEKEDARFVDLYHGETVNVTQSSSITANIPIDPVAKEKTPTRVFWEGIGRRAQKSVSLLTIIAMAGAFAITPTPIVGALLATNIIMYFVFRRIAAGRKPKNWGIVYDDITKKPLRNTVVRIFEAKYNKLLETKITDMRGRYAFLVGNNVYYVTFDKPGYRKRQEGPIDLIEVKKDEEQLIAENVALSPEKPKNFFEAIRARFRSLFSPLSKETASISKPPVSEKPKSKLIVGPGAEIPDIEPEVEEKKEDKKVEERPKSEGKKVPWELELLQKSGAIGPEQPAERPPEVRTEEAKDVADIMPETENVANDDARNVDQFSWEDQELQKLRYDGDTEQVRAGEPEPPETDTAEDEDRTAEVLETLKDVTPWADQSVGSDVGIGSLGSRVEEEKKPTVITPTETPKEPEEKSDVRVSGSEQAEEEASETDDKPADGTDKPENDSSGAWEDEELLRIMKEADENKTDE